MGVHLCAAWAQGGYDVTMCSRSADKARDIVNSLLSGNGYQKKVEGKNSAQGDYCVPPCDAKDWKLKAGDVKAASDADIIVLSTMYEQAWPILETIIPEIRGKHKIILDMTNDKSIYEKTGWIWWGVTKGWSSGWNLDSQGEIE